MRDNMAIRLMGQKAQEDYQQAEAELSARKNILQIADKLKEQPDFSYGQSIWIVEQDLIITELQVYGYGPSEIYVRRLNGIRTTVPHLATIWTTERAVFDNLERKRWCAKRSETTIEGAMKNFARHYRFEAEARGKM